MTKSKEHRSKTCTELHNVKLDETTTYAVENMTFIVQPVFKEKSNDTLGSVLLRLMTVNN